MLSALPLNQRLPGLEPLPAGVLVSKELYHILHRLLWVDRLLIASAASYQCLEGGGRGATRQLATLAVHARARRCGPGPLGRRLAPPCRPVRTRLPGLAPPHHWGALVQTRSGWLVPALRALVCCFTFLPAFLGVDGISTASEPLSYDCLEAAVIVHAVAHALAARGRRRGAHAKQMCVPRLGAGQGARRAGGLYKQAPAAAIGACAYVQSGISR
jgi:hypothetical protein